MRGTRWIVIAVLVAGVLSGLAYGQALKNPGTFIKATIN